MGGGCTDLAGRASRGRPPSSRSSVGLSVKVEDTTCAPSSSAASAASADTADTADTAIAAIAEARGIAGCAARRMALEPTQNSDAAAEQST